ncbi:MAG: 2,3-bisphosphoglycerate-independent phosphoglycerate mutase [Deltaproteobacteria bacterium]|nr:2,3-bisphosphoglycerate-independent phosphoglycerate mutase [Deltaproteobacteria bacterium]
MSRVALVVLDGWGQRTETAANAVAQARTPRLTALRREFSATTLGASGLDVGLPPGQMGNSEVGHLNLGAGRVVYQDYTRINLAIENGSFYDNPALTEACRRSVEAGGALHLMGLVSDGGVHSHQRHLYALLELARRQGAGRVYVHAFLDGRDTPPQSGLGYLEALEAEMARLGVGAVATVMGRFYAMDRDTRWDRVEKAFRALSQGQGIPAGSAREAVEAAYAEGQTDEFVVPRVIRAPGGGPVAALADGDALVFFNFRSDRAREITRAFTQRNFSAFDVAGRPALSAYVTFTQYDETFDLPMAFPPERLVHLFGEVVSAAGLRQLRIAETEKYAHVTFFFNGGEETSYPGEERILVPSPREVATYDLKPEMSAMGVADRLVAEIGGGRFDAIVVNFANLDMVGHTGILEATVRAVETVDGCVGRVVDALRARGYAAIVTADHGNAEEMWDPGTGQPHTAHTTNRVPCLLVDDRRRGARLRGDGILADVAPTLLELLGLTQPAEMSGRTLLLP